MNQITERIDRERATGAPATFGPRFAALLPSGALPVLTFRIGYPTRDARPSPPSAPFSDPMTRRVGRLRLSGTLGLLGAPLGVVAGAVQATAGSHIPHWSGNKTSPVALGLLTILLSCVALFCAVEVRRDAVTTPGRRIAAAIGLLVPGAVCFTTVGALWYVPGVLLLVSSALVVSAGDVPDSRAVVAKHWLRALISCLGAFEVLMAAGAGPLLMTVGAVSGVALIAAPWTPRRGVSISLLVFGTVSFAVLSWWSLVSPLVAILALVLGSITLLPRHSRVQGIDIPAGDGLWPPGTSSRPAAVVESATTIEETRR